MSRIANEYFHNIFAAHSTLDAAEVVDLFERVVSPDDNDRLCAPFTDKEISDAMFQIGSLKAPGPDGFPAQFFQHNWSMVKEGVIAAVRDFFSTGIMPEGDNATSIMIIPKISNP